MEGADDAIVLDVRRSGTIAWIGYSFCLCALLVLLWIAWDVRTRGMGGGFPGAKFYPLFGYFPAWFLAAPACGFWGVRGYTVARGFQLSRHLEMFTLTPVLLLLITVLLLHLLAIDIGALVQGALLIGSWLAAILIPGLIGAVIGRRRVGKAIESSVR